jgi:hypothetical protein
VSGVRDCFVDLAVILGADGGQKMRVVQKGQVMHRDHRFDRRVKGWDEVGAVQQVEPEAQQLHGQHRLLQAMVDGRKERGAPKVRLLEQRCAVLAMLEDDKLVVGVEFGQRLQ